MSERLLFVCIPTRLLLEPPLAHRGSSDPRTVTPFAFALLTGILVAARAKWREVLDYLLPDSLLHKLGSNVATKNLPTSCYTGIGPLLTNRNKIISSV